MKIALSGVHGQGKTTLLNQLKNIPEFRGYHFAESPTRDLVNRGISIGELGSTESQALVMFGHFANQINRNVILDRCALDGLAYTYHFYDQINVTVLSVIEQLFQYLISQYDIIFYIKPELEPVYDGTRPLNKEFFESIKNKFEYIINLHNIPVVILSGSVEQRIDKIINTFKNKQL